MIRIDWDRFDWSSLGRGWADDLRVATIFFTRLPIHSSDEITGEGIMRALRAWPLVGLGVGLSGGLIYFLATALGLAPLAAGLMALGTMTALTGALHEDGVADMADGLGGKDPAERLAIMRDSRLGAFGALALIFGIGLRAATLTQLAAPGIVCAALGAAAAGSRGLVPLLTLQLVPARRDGLGAVLGTLSQEVIVTSAVLGALTALLLLGPVAGIAALACGLGALAGVAVLAQRRLGGYTGDVLGAVQQTAEVAMLLAAAAVLNQS